MADNASLQSFTKDHLEGLRSEIDALLGHAKPATKSTSQTTCWSTNSEDVNVALAVIWAVSGLVGLKPGTVQFEGLVCASDT